MARPFRLTFRLSATELSAIQKYANQIHAMPSVALRCLIAKYLGSEKERGYIKKSEPRTSAGSS